MNLDSLIFAMALFLAIAIFIIFPVVRPTPKKNDFNRERYLLETRRVRILTAIADLDFEHSTGKIDQDVYESERARLLANGVETLKQIDAAGFTKPVTTNEPDTSNHESDN